VVKKTVAIEQLSFEEAAELAILAQRFYILQVYGQPSFTTYLSSCLIQCNQKAKGTLITELAGSVGVKAVAAKDGITAIKIKSSRCFWRMAF
jgi:aspartate kinase